jgi:predicted dehydrogenase
LSFDDSNEKRLGFAVVGLGNFGIKRIEAISESPRARLVCVFDTDISRAENVASSFGAQVQSFDDMLDDPAVRVIDIATPNRYHAEYAISALQAGKVVWCEKPLAPTIEQCRSILELARKLPRRAKVGSMVRFLPNILKLRELMSSTIGTPLFMRGYIGNAGHQLSHSSWYANPQLVGGGALLDLGIHLIDLIRCLIGEIESCQADVSSRMWQLDNLEDFATCILQVTGGARASIQSSWSEWCGYMYVEIYGTDGFIRSDNRGTMAKLTIGNREKIIKEYDYSDLPQVSYTNELNHFIECLEKSREFESSAYDGYRAVRVVRACYESARAGKKVSCVES